MIVSAICVVHGARKAVLAHNRGKMCLQLARAAASSPSSADRFGYFVCIAIVKIWCKCASY